MLQFTRYVLSAHIYLLCTYVVESYLYSSCLRSSMSGQCTHVVLPTVTNNAPLRWRVSLEAKNRTPANYQP